MFLCGKEERVTTVLCEIFRYNRILPNMGLGTNLNALTREQAMSNEKIKVEKSSSTYPNK